MEYKVKLPVFEGPLDLLLSLIKDAKVDIYDIPIELITKQYLDYISVLNELDIELASDFILMAATLLCIKSQMLLPVEVVVSDDILTEDPRKGLVEKLLEYQKFKESAIELSKKENFVAQIFTRQYQNQFLNDNNTNYVDVSLFELLQAFRNVMKKVPEKEFPRIELEPITVEMKIIELKQKLENQSKIYFTELFSTMPSKLEIIVCFLAILELVKIKFIVIQQHQLFGDIRLIRREK